MFFIFSKLLAFIFNPLIWIIGLLLFAFFSQKFKKGILISLVLLFIFGNSFILDEFMRWWEWPTLKAESLEPCEAAVVLGGGMASWDNSFQRINFVKSTDRFLQAIDLYKKGKIKKIIISGGKATIFEDYGIESELIKKYLILIGIPDSCVFAETKSANTFQNAVYTAEQIKEHQIKGKIVLITSATHMRRSIACFKNQNISFIPYSTDRMSGIRKYDFEHLFIPSIDAIQKWNTLIHEWIGYLAYKMNGYL